MTLNQAIRVLAKYHGAELDGADQALKLKLSEPDDEVWEAWRVLLHRLRSKTEPTS